MKKTVNKLVALVMLFLMINLFIFGKVFAITSVSKEEITEDNNEQTENDSNDLRVKFFEMGDGDCTLIKMGDTEILIDAGEKSAEKVKQELKKEVSSDGVLDYVFTTHGDSDHIKNMNEILPLFNPSSDKNLGGTDGTKYVINNFIDFDTEYARELYSSDTYKTYVNTRNAMIDKSENKDNKNKGIKNYYPINEFYEKNQKIEFSESGLVLHVLKNKYYFETPPSKNNGSICLMLEYGKAKILLTGDLESEGELGLLEEYRNSDLLDNVTLFKAGHHGSRTSSTKPFVDTIKPQYVMITCCAGGTKHNFPRQESLNNFLTYTDYIFISSVLNKDAGEISYHGDVTFNISKDNDVDVECSNNDSTVCDDNGNYYPITQTNWFAANREANLKMYVFNGYQSKNRAYVGNCTLVKYGHYDILIDCGVFGKIGNDAEKATNFVEDVKEYCVDGVIEYVIVTSPYVNSISQLVDVKTDTKTLAKGIFSEFKIEKLIDYGISIDPSEGAERSFYKEYNLRKEELIKNGTLYKSAKECLTLNGTESDFLSVCPNLKINILENEFYEYTLKDHKDDSCVALTVEFYKSKLLFTGNMTSSGEKSIVENNDLSNVVFYLASDYGYIGANSSLLLDTIKNKQKLFIAVNTTLNENIFGKITMNRALCDRLINSSKCVLVTVDKQTVGGKTQFEKINDIEFTLKSNGVGFFENTYLPLQETDYYQSLPQK